ncbi:DHA1 family multidrug resistance protein-like MFS transporter [Neobacillus bataviensis]|uniref:DHA1 family multidrug resistance protein-like MFS transporter n=1 Tax=Neobacillus bataviensis TaxID=220685 RepID=A0A561DYU3_9BACI|nr:MFS transporter [Neobacillus bataviensis]TWE08492.1 DHA1 family multidrug resistance protein-like MFS transporter [Neobacillus bataviensis]
MQRFTFLRKMNMPLLILMVNIFIALLGVGLAIPVLPKFILDIGATGKDQGYLVAATGLTQFLFSPFGGKLSDKYGRKIITIAGLGIIMLSQLMFSFASDLWLLYLSRLIGGIGIGILVPANMAYVADVTTIENRGKGMGLLGAAISLGFVIGPGLGGFLAEFGIRVPFFASAFAAGIAMVVSFLFLPETLSKEQQYAARNSKQEKDGMVHDILRSYKVSYFVLLLLVLTMTFGLANFEAIYGLYVSEKYDYTPKDISIILTVGALVGVIIQAVLVDWLLRRFDEIKVINTCFILSAVSMVFVLLSGNFLYMLIMNVFFFLFTSILRPAINTLLSKMAGKEQGFAAGMNNAYSSLGNIIGPSLAGILYDVSYNIPFVFGAFILLGSMVMCVIWNQKARRNSDFVSIMSGQNQSS